MPFIIHTGQFTILVVSIIISTNYWGTSENAGFTKAGKPHQTDWYN